MKAKSQFELFLDDEVGKMKGISYPVRAGLLRRLFIKNMDCRKMHPNPNDEFCFPDIGPNYEIISGYVNDYKRYHTDLQFAPSSVSEPIEIERIKPHGYMILNGHHRWAAAMRAGEKRISVRVVDLTQKKDVEKMLRNSRSDRRVTLDLDEVVFRPADEGCLEKPLPFPLSRIYRERLRLGIPALFHFLKRNGYDIWIYSARNYSLDYVRYYFLHYFIYITCIVTGTGRKAPEKTETRKELEKLLSTKYKSTIHIDNKSVIYTVPETRQFDEFPLSGNPETWSREVIAAVEKIREGG